MQSAKVNRRHEFLNRERVKLFGSYDAQLTTSEVNDVGMYVATNHRDLYLQWMGLVAERNRYQIAGVSERPIDDIHRDVLDNSLALDRIVDAWVRENASIYQPEPDKVPAATAPQTGGE